MTSKILIIDDDPNLLESLSEVLRGEGYQVGTAVTGEEGFRIIIELCQQTPGNK